ncbi:phosphatase PAP2 family protein [Lysinibacillus sp. SGAir0095]|uniref:phosphatase PAP2 family protein n=1 Tax=Lysinibacillus sp. SGAir0095 TaxID=2070463 RepID=UPI0010CD4386|nr:phosphatase PAP2 family protein [Lysinibacillus sp. SGAir0095]QCR31228.1 phosphatidylglycerophosphatase [Lysinibacillus sp. SGAir0095]
MNKVHYIFALFTFVVFCILWMTYETDAIKAFDQRASDLLFGIDSITWFHYLGETKVIFGVSLIVLVMIWVRLRDYNLMFFVFLTIGIGYGLYQFLKRVVERPRPEIVDQFTTFSFPSGHATHGILFLLTLAFVFSRLVKSKKASQVGWIMAIIIFVLIGLSRVTEGRHFASDVLAGWSLGYTWFIICAWWYFISHSDLNKLPRTNSKN